MTWSSLHYKYNVTFSTTTHSSFTRDIWVWRAILLQLTRRRDVSSKIIIQETHGDFYFVNSIVAVATQEISPCNACMCKTEIFKTALLLFWDRNCEQTEWSRRCVYCSVQLELEKRFYWNDYRISFTNCLHKTDCLPKYIIVSYYNFSPTVNEYDSFIWTNSCVRWTRMRIWVKRPSLFPRWASPLHTNAVQLVK